MEKNWIVIVGTLINTTAGDGGLEFFGPYTEEEAEQVRRRYVFNRDLICQSVQLIGAGIPKRIQEMEQ